METLLALEMVGVTEAAAIASARLMGRGDRHAADRVAVEAMRQTLEEVEVNGTIVIGEGERDEAPMLWIGEQVGKRGPGQVAIDIAVDPLEGTNLVASGQSDAITVLAASEAGAAARRVAVAAAVIKEGATHVRQPRRQARQEVDPRLAPVVDVDLGGAGGITTLDLPDGECHVGPDIDLP